VRSRARTIVQLHGALRASRPQLRRDPLGSYYSPTHHAMPCTLCNHRDGATETLVIAGLRFGPYCRPCYAEVSAELYSAAGLTTPHTLWDLDKPVADDLLAHVHERIGTAARRDPPSMDAGEVERRLRGERGPGS